MEDTDTVPLLENGGNREESKSLGWRVWDESKKLWRIVGPAIFQRLALYSTVVITQAFAGHFGDLELAAFSISSVITGFCFGLYLGMASALETLCGQAYGAKKYHMLGIYLQRSWIVLFLCAVMLLPIYFYTTPILKLCGEPEDLAKMAGAITIWQIPQNFAYAMNFPVSRLFMFFFGGCPDTWKGFSMEAFDDMWEFVKLSASSGVMLCLENWYYRVLVLLTGYLPNAELAVDALTICMSISSWELMIPLAFFAGTGVRVANELGAGKGHAAKFAMIVSVMTSLLIGIFFWVLILVFNDKIALVFTTSEAVRNVVNKLIVLLASTILLNSIQPVLSGVAVGSGWQSLVAYVNIGSYYLIGVPFGIILGWTFHYGVSGIWAGMIGGTFVQTIVLVVLTIRCNWTEEAIKASKRLSKWDK